MHEIFNVRRPSCESLMWRAANAPDNADIDAIRRRQQVFKNDQSPASQTARIITNSKNTLDYHQPLQLTRRYSRPRIRNETPSVLST